jgi:hypothetical protein
MLELYLCSSMSSWLGAQLTKHKDNVTTQKERAIYFYCNILFHLVCYFIMLSYSMCSRLCGITAVDLSVDLLSDEYFINTPMILDGYEAIFPCA